jgi:hypothetical protein
MINPIDKEVPAGKLKPARMLSQKPPFSHSQSHNIEARPIAKRQRFMREYRLSVLDKADHSINSVVFGELRHPRVVFASTQIVNDVTYITARIYRIKNYGEKS